MKIEDYKLQIKAVIIDKHNDVDLHKLEMFMKVMDYKIKRHYLNGRTPKQAVGYIAFKS